MPYESLAQEGYMHAAAERGDVDPKVVAEFDRATARSKKKLPKRVKKTQPGGSSVHVAVPLGSEEDRVIKAAFEADENDQNLADLYQRQELISGIDYELRRAPGDTGAATRVAQENLQTDPSYYRHAWQQEQMDPEEQMIAAALGIQKEELPDGLDIDIGSGQCRAEGHIGVDVYPYDHGTVVHDVTMGLPFPDASVRRARLTNSLNYMDGVDAQALLAEIHRVLLPGGQLHYEGPTELTDFPAGLQEIQRDQIINKGGPGSGGAETKEIGMPHSPHVSVGTRKSLMANIEPTLAMVPMAKITHVGQRKYVPKKLKEMVKSLDGRMPEDIKPIHVLKVGSEFHVMDGHHRYLAARKHGMAEIPAHVYTKTKGVQKANPGWVQQTLFRLATPDAATANDTSPGMVVGDPLSADALLALDAMSYVVEDQASSGPGNRAAGYPSVNKKIPGVKDLGHDETGASGGISKGGPGSGPRKGADTAARDKKRNEDRLRASEHQAEQNRAKTEARRSGHDGANHAAHHGEHFNPIEAANAATEESVHKISKQVKILKTLAAKQIVYGVVLAPDEADLQNDFMQAPDIEETAHGFMLEFQQVGKNHSDAINAKVVESYIAPVDFEIEGQHGPQIVKKGSWVLAAKILDPAEWRRVVDGEYTGWSVGGEGVRDRA